jgi:Uma2 family endonuclease
MMPIETHIWTEAELLNLKHEGFKCELVNGDVVMSPAGNFDHGNIIARLIARLTIYAVFEKKLGEVFDGQSGRWMKSGNMRCADIWFMSKARIKAIGGPRQGFLHGAPDLAVEVLSPSETVGQTEEKLKDYFESGSRLVWIVNPADKSVMAYRSLEVFRVLHESESLDGEDVVPGFSMPVAELFAPLDLD